MPWLINPLQLEKFRKNQKNVVILDATWHLPNANETRDAKLAFFEEHIVGARFLDLDDFLDQENPIPNMLLRDEALISQKLGALGITNDHKIILYDHSDLHTSCRALWMFKVFGHNPQQLYILDGGFEAWRKFDGKREAGDARQVMPKTYNVNYQAQWVRTLVQMKANLHHPKEQVIDLRHPVRYAGGPEARENMRPGHLPGSYSFPYQTLFDKEGYFKPLDKLCKQIAAIGVELNYPIVSTCGSGMTAAILNFVLDLLSQSQHALYDGSWSEWGSTELYVGEASLAERPVVRSVDQ